MRLRLTGTKLDQVDEAVLRGHIGKIEARNDKGTAMSVVFTAEQTRSFRTSNLDSVVLTSKGKSPIEIKVMLIRAAGD